MLILEIWVGVATWYDPYEYSDPPCVFCGGGLPREAWVAVNVRFYQEERIKCGDRMLLLFPDGTTLQAKALDAGPFDGYYVEQWGRESPIVVDVAKQYWPKHPALSSRVKMINVEPIYQALEEAR